MKTAESKTVLKKKIQLFIEDKHIPGVKVCLSILVPVYNQASILPKHLPRLHRYLCTLSDQFDWELLLINDASTDGTKEILQSFCEEFESTRLIHHKVHRNFGGALRRGFRESIGDVVIVFDINFTLSEESIEWLLVEMAQKEADVVVASPCMQGGKLSNISALDKFKYNTLNRFMKFSARGNISTFTGMARAYKSSLLKQLNLKSSTRSINPEIIHKAKILRARLEEIPVQWDGKHISKHMRQSSWPTFSWKEVLSNLMSGFIFRPYVFFLLIGCLLMGISIYMLTWILIHLIDIYPSVDLVMNFFDDRFSQAVAQVFSDRPYAFFVGGTTLIVALQFLGIGFLSLQNKRYFDELFHISTHIFKNKK